MLVIDFLIPIITCHIIRSSFFKLIFLINYLIFMNVTWLFSESSVIGGLSTLISLLTNTAINYYTLLLLLLFWANEVNFFNKVSTLLLLSFSYTTIFILNSVKTDSINASLSKSFINLDLFNGVLSIHPLMLLLSLTTVSYILVAMLVSQRLAVINLLSIKAIKTNLNLRLSKEVLKSRYLSFLALYLNILSIVLGAYWAHQELSWGGYWSWDPIEMFSLVVLMLALLVSHSLKNTITLNILPLLFIVLITVLSLVRLNAVSSIHGFLDIQDLRFSLTSFLLALVLSLISLGSVLYRLTDLTLILKGATLKYFFKPLKVLLIGFNTIFFTCSLVYLLSVIPVNSIKPIPHNQLILCFLIFIILISIKKNTLLALLLPVLEANTLCYMLLNYRSYFLTKITHFVIIILFFFFLNYSHVFFISTTSLNFYSTVSSVNDKLVILSSLFCQYLNDYSTIEADNIIYFLNKNCYIESLCPYFIDIISSLPKTKSEQFCTYLFKGSDYIYFGSNLFFKNTATYPLFILSFFWIITYSIANKNKKNYSF